MINRRHATADCGFENVRPMTGLERTFRSAGDADASTTVGK